MLMLLTVRSNTLTLILFSDLFNTDLISDFNFLKFPFFLNLMFLFCFVFVCFFGGELNLKLNKV